MRQLDVIDAEFVEVSKATRGPAPYVAGLLIRGLVLTAGDYVRRRGIGGAALSAALTLIALAFLASVIVAVVGVGYLIANNH
jgi:hypothetical protein